jgi:hypothetical protein
MNSFQIKKIKKKKKMDTLQDIYVLLDTPHTSEIVPNLFLGSIEAVKTPDFINTMDLVISLVSGHHVPESYFIGIINQEKTKHVYIDIRDRPESRIDTFFISTHQLITQYLEQKKKVLVHCMQGRSRSATIVTAHLMQVFQWSVYKSLAFCKHKRAIIRPNRGFLQQLIDFSKEEEKGEKRGAEEN